MNERLLILVAFGVTLAAGWWVWRLWLQQRIAHLQEQALPALLSGQIVAGQPAVIYFTSDGCVQCKFQQAPVLERFAADTGIAVHTVDALSQAEIAEFYGVMTVPTTVVLDRQRRPIAINLGMAPLQKLRQQTEIV